MKRTIRIGLIALLLGQLAIISPSRGQDVKPEDIKKLYDDTLVQLKAAQDRKSQLATDNEKLAAKVGELEKQVAAQKARIEDLKQQTATFTDRTFFLRVHYMAWGQFLEGNPLIRLQWDLFLDRITAPLSPSPELPFIDPEWPLSSRG
ncbi:MAG: hypothetical protein M3O30_07275 [Planctomycetota bacterium]|nr:hypothetical protein [Planctomycetota bacterium]